MLSSIWLFAAFPYTDLGSSESPTVSTSTFRSTNLFLFSHHHIPTNRVAPFSAYKHTQPKVPTFALTKG